MGRTLAPPGEYVAVTHDGDVVGVAAERVDVLADVVQRGDEVEQRVVAGRRVIRQAQETCSTRPPLTHSLTHSHDPRTAPLHDE